jgi:subtilisin family serine protease
MKQRFLLAILLALILLAPTLALAQHTAPLSTNPWSSVVGLRSPAAQNVTNPNDPLFPDQWALKHVGATCAWQSGIGSPDVTVAVVDSGVDLTHPDLVGRLRDDGHDFVDGDDDPSDENGHGTNVAGIIAATLDNGEGGAGLAPGVMILPVRVMNAKGYGSDRAIARGVRYAADKGAKVINLSLGATLTIGADTESELVTSAIHYAQDKGALVVVAAGNDFAQLPNAIVGDNPDTLVVAATDDDDRKADFSNSGAWIGVTAPGVHILSTMPTYEVYLTSDQVPRDERFENNYDYMSGTSQATPLVSALAALEFSAHTDWDARQVAQEIKDRAADISKQNRKLVAKGFLGAGRIDACAALGGQAAKPTAPAAPEATAPAAPEATAPRAAQPGAPAPSRTPTRSGGSLLLVLAAGACGVALLLTFLIVALVRGGRRRAPLTPAPLWTPGGSSTPVQPPVGAPAPLPAGAWGMLTVVGGPSQPARYPLVGAETLIGRESYCAIQLPGDGTVSRRHAIVRNDGRQITVIDAGSTHGTYLNGQRVTAPAVVRRGMLLQVGQTLLRFE